jgi:hypothetical protein
LNLHDAGHNWIWILAPALVLVGIYRLGEDEDRAYFHRAWSRLTGRPARPENREERRALEE